MNTNAYIPPDHYDLIKRRLRKADQALCDLLLLTGFRVSDLLKARNYQVDSVYISLYEAKTGKRRTVATSPEIRRALSSYRRYTHQNEEFGGRNPLACAFVSERGRKGDRAHLSRTTIYRRFAKAVYMAGLAEKGYSLHSLRKCYAVNLYEKSGSLLVVQRDLGHSSMSTTCLYVFGSRATL